MIFKPHELNAQCRLWQFREHLPTDGSMYWLYDTYGTREDVKYNAGCYDVSKSRVHAIHEEALGYSAKVNPRTAVTPFLEKPELQCRHNQFSIVNQNCEPKDGFVYERLFDNRTEIRYFFCRTGEDFLLIKHREQDDFLSYLIYDVIIQERSLFVSRFCDLFGIDFAELDILFDGNTPYITDVNNIAGMGMTANKFVNPDDYDLVNKLYINQIKSL
jgi:hypothetical protein